MALRSGYYGIKKNYAKKINDGAIPTSASPSNPMVTQIDINTLQRRYDELGSKNLANFVQGKGINVSGEVVNDSNRIATVEPIAIKSNIGYKYISTATPNTPVCIYAVYNDDILVRRVAGVESGAILNTSDGNKLYVCVYKTDAITIDDAKAMIVLDTDDVLDYEPFAATNRDLTLKVEGILAAAASAADFAAFKTALGNL